MRFETSFTKIENELSPGMRERLNSAEGAVDVQHIFAEFLQEILSRISGAAVVLDEGDVRVDPAAPDGFVLGPGIAQNPDYARYLAESDLLDILRRQAEHAAHKINYMRKHPELEQSTKAIRQGRKPTGPR
jgi:hypothetical protein